MKKFLPALCFFVSLFGLAHAELGTKEFTIDISGVEREYLVHLPPQFDSKKNTPLLIKLHGQDTNAYEALSYSELNELADQENFVVVYPQSLHSPLPFFEDADLNHWDVYGLESDAAFKDVEFIESLTKHLIKTYNLSPDQVYLSGFSNGAAFAQRLVCERPETFAGLLIVGFDLPDPIAANCSKLNMPIVFVRGTQDPLVPFGGFENFTPGAEVAATKLASINGCSTERIETRIIDSDPEDSTTVTQYDFKGCQQAPVRFYRVNNGGHTWPGVATILNPQIFGHSNNDLKLNQVAWAFLSQQRDELE